MNIEHDGSICTLHLLALWITECKAIFVRIDPNAEGTPKQSSGLRVLALEDNELLGDQMQSGSGRTHISIACLGIYQGLNRGSESADGCRHAVYEIH
jgi:hypothetical protein